MIRRLFQITWEKILILAGSLLVLLPMNPRIMKMPFRDSGVFLYGGWRILNGEVPYLHFWDHKPPIIFYINALGLALRNNSRWGVWALEFISLSLAAWLGYKLIREYLGTQSAILGLFLFFSGVILTIEGGNFTEEFALPFQFGSLWLAKDADKHHFNNARGLAVGSLAALAFFTKQTAIGIGIGILLFLCLQRLATGHTNILVVELASIFVGFALIASGIVLFFAQAHALDQFIDAAFLYNFSYINPNSGGIRLPSLFLQNGLLQLGLAGFGLAMWRWKSIPVLVKITLISLPCEFALADLAGYSYRHYYLTILPSLMMLAAFVLRFLLDAIKRKIYQCALSIVIIILFVISQAGEYQNRATLYAKQHPAREMNAALQTHSDEYFQVWGSETAYNFMSQRIAPSRFNYLYPLYDIGYTREELIIEFLDDLLVKKPVILDTHAPTMPLFSFPLETPEIQSRLQTVESHYYLSQEFKSGWAVYKYFE